MGQGHSTLLYRRMFYFVVNASLFSKLGIIFHNRYPTMGFDISFELWLQFKKKKKWESNQ